MTFICSFKIQAAVTVDTPIKKIMRFLAAIWWVQLLGDAQGLSCMVVPEGWLFLFNGRMPRRAIASGPAVADRPLCLWDHGKVAELGFQRDWDLVKLGLGHG